MNNFVKFSLAIAVVAIAAYGVYVSQKTDIISDLMLTNMEALADSKEGSGNVDCCNSSDCSGNYCGIFYPAGSMNGVKLYYK